MDTQLKVGQRVRVCDSTLWCSQFTGTVIIATLEYGELMYWVKPDAQCSAAGKLQFKPEQLEVIT
jgi:hypothetical protein